MKKALRTFLLATTLVLPAVIHAEDAKMCDMGTSCPMKGQLGGMQKQMGDMMEQMQSMMDKPCDEATKKGNGSHDAADAGYA